MKPLPSPDIEMLGAMLDALHFAVYTFDRERRVIYANAAAKQQEAATERGGAIGAAEKDHFKDNEYYDEDGNHLPQDRLTILDRAFRGEETRDLLIEHRDLKNRTHKWLEISCIPVMTDTGEFSYGILISRELSQRKKREEKLRFLLESMKILSITMEFKSRLQRKAALAVPALADWCSIEIMNAEKKLEREVLIHRDPQKIELIKEYERRYPRNPGDESPSERVVRTGKGEFTPLITDEMIEKAPGLTPEQREAILKLELSSMLVLPIGPAGKVLGTLTLAYAESGRVYTEEDFHFFGEFAQHLGVLLDNARLYNEIRQRDQAKDIFLASLSHELRNPLAPIRSSLELLRIENKDEALVPELDVIDHQFDHMTHLLDDLLDATRFMQGKITVDLAPIEVMGILRQVTQALRPVAEKKEIRVSIESAAAAYTVHADRVRLEQAFTNIVNNALKFTPPGGSIRISVRAEGQDAVIQIRDSGAGLTSEERARIFEPYYQSERVQSSNPGIGIGLRLVHEIIELHHGTIAAESEGMDKGSTFIITLPLMPESVAAEEAAPEATAAAAPGKRVIIVDDNQAAADGLVRLLKAMGWDARALYSGGDFLSYLSREQVDIAFVDIGMPEMDGYDVIQAVREKGYVLPVVALTGYGLTEDKQETLAAGFTAHLTKPIGAAELRSTLAELLDLS